VKHYTIVMALTCLLTANYCVSAYADGFKFPTISNPFKKLITARSTESMRPMRITGSNISAANRAPAPETSSFSLPKLKLPKFKMPSFRTEVSRVPVSTRRPSSRTTITRQSRSNYNRRSEPSGFDKFSQGTKRFFDKAKSTLMPWTDDTVSTPSRSSVPSRSWSRNSNRTHEVSTRTGFTFPWSNPRRETEAEPNGVSEFLALPGRLTGR